MQDQREREGGFDVECHEPVSELLAFYLTGTVDANETRKIEDHLPECTECQQRFALLMRLSVRGLPGDDGSSVRTALFRE